MTFEEATSYNGTVGQTIYIKESMVEKLSQLCLGCYVSQKQRLYKAGKLNATLDARGYHQPFSCGLEGLYVGTAAAAATTTAGL